MSEVQLMFGVFCSLILSRMTAHLLCKLNHLRILKTLACKFTLEELLNVYIFLYLLKMLSQFICVYP